MSSRVLNEELVVHLEGAERERVGLPDIEDWQVAVSQDLHRRCIIRYVRGLDIHM